MAVMMTSLLYQATVTRRAQIEVAPQSHPPDYTPHAEEKMLQLENALLLANQNHAQLQSQMENLQQENEKLKTEHAKLLKSTKDAKTAPKGFPYCYGSATSLEEELHNIKNAAIIAYQQNIHLRSQLESLMKQNQQLQAEYTEAKTIVQHYEEVMQEKSILRVSTFKHDKHEKTAALHDQEKKNVTQEQMPIAQASLINQKNNNEIEELPVELCQKDEDKNEVLALQSDSQEVCKITRQLQDKEAENSFTVDKWQIKYESLQEQLKKELSEKKQSWETRFKQVQEEKIVLQHDNKKLAAERSNLQREQQKLLEKNTQLKQEHTQLKEEMSKLVDNKIKLEKETTQLLQDKTKLEEEKAKLEEHSLELQKKLKKKKGFWSRL
ncbi:hypothetical protein Q5P01_024490 [Channa striata]|uniref:Uncharacterized protein n=1 Tax=Channa striata TaxID=64152 RepID=A0AA88ITT7_CHASR|nr:hypothetical protein Q5P01_024490 [Channa striata]